MLKDGGYLEYGPKIIPNPNAEGGGGGGDYSTATVTIINNIDATTYVYIPVSGRDWQFGEVIFASVNIGDYADVTVTAVLGKNGSIACLDPLFSGTISTTGDAEVDETNNIIITGDCTITLSE